MVETEPLTAIVKKTGSSIFHLKEVLPNVDPLTMQGARDFLCLDNTKFGLNRAIDWIRVVRHYGNIPKVFIIITDSSYGQTVLRDQIQQIGGCLWKSYGSSSFEIEFKKLAAEISKRLNRPKRKKVKISPRKSKPES